MTVEIAPVLLAVRNHYPEGTQVQLGGVVSLISEDQEADVATNAETQALRQSVKRPDIRIIMTLVEGRYRIVARRSAGIDRLADLRGKRIATLRATSADYFLAKMLERGGLTTSDVTVVEILPLEDMVPAIEKNEIDAVAIWEPFSENVLRALGSDAVEISGEGIYRELFNLNTTAGALADPETRREIVSFMRAIIDANEEMNRDPAEAQAMVAESGGYTLEEVVNSWPHHGFVASFAGDMLDVLVEEETWLAAEEKRQPRSREELASLIDRSVYDEARALPAKP
jgi:NitT/TauT family transport system substrate-binding protein